MIQQLFPQLPLRLASTLAERHATATVDELRALASHHHPNQIFSATGGQQVSHAELDELAKAVREVMASRPPRESDSQLARVIHPRLRITRHEASLDGVWSFLGCVLLPDLVRWRFSGNEATPPDRFLGTGRGLRNVVGRAWWRGELLYDAGAPQGRDPYWLLDELVEDELTGIIERPHAVASRRVAVALARALLEVNCKNMLRMEVARDAFKHHLRYGYFVEFDALADEELSVSCASIYRRSVKNLLEDRESRASQRA